MCIRQVERELDFNNEIEQLLTIDLKEDIHYVQAEIGISALGYLYVDGAFKYHGEKRLFEELVEIDILAPYEKLKDPADFKVEVDCYDYIVKNGNLKLVINLKILGLCEDENHEACEEQLDEVIDIANQKNADDNKIKEHIIQEIEDKIDDYVGNYDTNISSSKLTRIVNRVIDDNIDDVEVSANLQDEEVSLAPLLKSNLDENVDFYQLTHDIYSFDEDEFDDLEDEESKSLADELNDLNHQDDDFEFPFLKIHFDEEESESDERGEACHFNNDLNDHVDLEAKCENPCIIEVEELFSKNLDDYQQKHQKCQSKGSEPMFFSNKNIIDYDHKPQSKENLFNFYSNEDNNDDSIDDNSVESNEEELYDFYSDLDDLLKENTHDKIIDLTISEKHEEIENAVKAPELLDSEIANVVNFSEIIEDIFDDDFNVTQSVKYYIATSGETYASIAAKYKVDSQKLANYNQNKPINGKTIIEILQ